MEMTSEGCQMEKIYSSAQIAFEVATKRGTPHEGVRAVVDYCSYWMTNIESERDRYRKALEEMRDTWFKHLCEGESCHSLDFINKVLNG